MFNGKSSLDYGLTIENLPDAAFPERRGEAYDIDGRNGTRFREDGTFENYEQTYDVFIRDEATKRNVYEISGDIAKWLIGSSGYCRLEDTYFPESFRLARFAGSVNFSAVLRRYGRATLVFNCQPERYLKSGEDAIEIDLTSGSTIGNPTGFTALPKITVLGSGTVGLSLLNMARPLDPALTIRLDIGSSQKTIVLDSETCTAKAFDITHLNGYDFDSNVTFSGPQYATFPQFNAGSYIIQPATGETYTGTISQIEIVPRWWTL